MKDCVENILIFTDGSRLKRPKYTHWFGIIDGIADLFPTQSSIFQAEEMAIWNVCKI